MFPLSHNVGKKVTIFRKRTRRKVAWLGGEKERVLLGWTKIYGQ